MTFRSSVRRLARSAGWGLTLLTLLLPPTGVAIAAESGTLRIESQPGVEVTWEGVSLGTTDASGVIEISGIPPGSYSVLLRKSGHESRSLPVEVEPGETALSLPLLPLTPPPAPRRAPGPAPTAPPKAELAAPARAAPAEPAPAASELAAGPGEPEPAGDSAEPPAAVTVSRAKTPIVAALAAVVGALLIVVLLRARAGAAARRMAPAAAPEPPPARSAPKSVGSAGLGALREELRRREEALERSESHGDRSAKPEVIDVDDFEIIDGHQ